LEVRGVHFTILPASPCAAEFYEFLHTRSTHRRNHVCQIFSRSVQGLRSSDTPKLPFPIDLLCRPYNSVALPSNTVKLTNQQSSGSIQPLRKVYLFDDHCICTELEKYHIQKSVSLSDSDRQDEEVLNFIEDQESLAKACNTHTPF